VSNKHFLRGLWFYGALSFFLVVGSVIEVKGEQASRPEFWTPQNPPKAHYKIECSIDPANGLLQGTEVISFKNTSSKPMRRLTILWVSDGNLEIISNNDPVPIIGQTKDSPVSSRFLIELPEPIIPDEEVSLQLKFSVSAPNYLKGENIRLPVFYPQLWWDFATHNDFKVKIKLPKEYTLSTSGLLDKKTGYYYGQNIRSFGLFLGKGFKSIETNAKDVLVQVVYKAEAEECAQMVLETAVQAINFYRERFGFYPYQNLTIVPGGMTHPAGGYPIATSLVGIHAMEQLDSMPKLHWQWITAHEIGHQYCGEYMLSKDPTDSFDWLMIGLGIYADREYTRARNLSSAKHQGLMNRYIKGVRAGFDTTINITAEQRSKIKFDFNNVVEHGKSYSVISALDCVLGKDVFSRIYQRCLKEFGGKRLGIHEFRTVCEKESEQDLGWFFDQWVNSNRYLSYEISSKKCRKIGSSYKSEIEVKCLGSLKMPVPVAAYFEDGTSQIKFTDRLLDTEVLGFESSLPLKEVRLDPANKLAMVVPPPSLNEQELSKKIKQLPWTGAGKNALNVFNKVKESNSSNPGSWFKLGLTLYDGQYYKEALEAFQRTHELSEKASYRYPVSLVWQGHLLDLLGQRKEALICYEKVLKESKDFQIQHDQYKMVINREWVEKRIKQPFQPPSLNK